MRRKLQKGDVCLNCGRALHDENFCPDCGQLNDTSKPTFGQLMMDALANLFAFDSKFYLSLWPLMRRPGQLSLDVVEGRKSSYLPPIRLFVLITIIMLATNSLIDRCQRGFSDTSHLRENKELALTVENDSIAKEALKKADNYKSEDDIDLSFSLDDSNSGQFISEMLDYAKKHPEQTTEMALREMQKPNTFSNRVFYSYMLKMSLMNAQQFKSYIQSNLLLILLMFIPVLALMLKLLYFYKGIYYVDHFIFSLHTQTAFFVYVTAYLIFDQWLGQIALLLIFLAFPIYLLFAIKNFYKQRWLFTVLNFFVINISFILVSLIFIFLVAAVSFLLI